MSFHMGTGNKYKWRPFARLLEVGSFDVTVDYW